MRFRVLGPLRVGDGVAWSPIRAAQQRVVLAVLLIEAGHVVTTERLIDEIWGERPPRAAVGTIHGYLMQLRRMLGSQTRLETRGRGYELLIEDGDLDATVFDGLVELGKRNLADGALELAVGHLGEALALWHGPALADVPASPTVSAEALRLEQARLTALEARFGAQLDLGRHLDVVDELHRLAQENPLRERLWQLFILALHRSGRRAEALDAYQTVRRELIEELGLEPGQPLRDLQAAILADDPRLAEPAPSTASAPGAGGLVRPAQLPADVAWFTGREEDLKALDALLPATDDAHPALVVISTIDGSAGVGKTALAVHWAHRVRDRFPDGQLYVNLRGHAAGRPLQPVEALARFLRALGVPARNVPVETDEAAALYRSLLSGQRILVLLDNANHPDQVRPLLPGSAGCLALVTSRDQLGGLVARDGAVRRTLDILPPTEAHALLASMIGADRAGAEPEPLAAVAAVCGYLPLALCIAAANLTSRPAVTIADYAAELASGDRLSALQVDGDPHATVRTALDHSYAALPPAAQRMFRLLGLVPGPHFSAEAAAALADVPVAQAAGLLARLARAHLLEAPAAGRYALHDLLRRYAAEHATALDSEPERGAALDRLFAFYLHGVAAAAGHLYPQVLRLPLPARPAGSPTVGLADDKQASTWLDDERPNLVAAVVTAADTAGELRAMAWLLADAIRGYLFMRMYTVDWLTVATAALAAADADGDLLGQAASHTGLATLYWAQGQHQEAIDRFSSALALSRRAGWVEGESAALGNLGNLYWALGHLDNAVEHYTEALAGHRRTGQLAGQATALGNLGLVYFLMGRLDEAASHHHQALALYKQTSSRAGEARALMNLGDTYHALGRLDEALATLTTALDLAREIGYRNVEGDAARSLAAVHRDANRNGQALALAGAAVELARETGDRRLQAGALTTLASVNERLGQCRSAIAGHREAVEVACEIGDRHIETEALIGLAAAHCLAGQPEEAASYARQALTIARQDEYGLLERRALEVLAAIGQHDDRSTRGDWSA
jgi:DNA-binding SARP family transcriptional activator/tetratricopeptide (TPR) repeat protein